MEILIISFLIITIVLITKVSDLKQKIENLEKRSRDNINKSDLKVFDSYQNEKYEKTFYELSSIIDNQNITLEELYNKNIEQSSKIKELTKKIDNIVNIKEDSLKINENSFNNINDNELSDEKKRLFDKMENTNDNMFITGKAGTGKSYLLKYFQQRSKKKVIYLAPTGIAALNIKGETIHSAFGYNNLMEDKPIKLSNQKRELLKNIETIIIDEISMVRVDIFNQMDVILKEVNKNNLSFGGKQIIIFGDLFQLPPIASKGENEYYTDKYSDIYFFKAPAYKTAYFKFYELEKVYRQNDTNFIRLLDDIRMGNIKKEDIAELNKRNTIELPERTLQIVPRKNDAHFINMNKLNELPTPEFTYNAKFLTSKNLNENEYACSFELKLKVGAMIMMITNDIESNRWVNGTIGIVSYLDEKCIKVVINGIEYEINPHSFGNIEYFYNKETKKLEYTIKESVIQYPLILAYAITIHKSQGMTYQKVICNLDSCFAPGQAYVALSRCRSLDSMYLTNEIDSSTIIVNKILKNFYLDLLKNKINLNNDKE